MLPIQVKAHTNRYLSQQEQERLTNRDRSTREAEQERQWKQLQALRQQQAQLQQQVIHEQRVHGKKKLAKFFKHSIISFSNINILLFPFN